MNKIIKGMLIFGAGIAIGGYAGYIVALKKCDKILEEEATAWREALNERKEQMRIKKERLIKEAEGIDEMSASVETKIKKNNPRDNYKKIVKNMKYDQTERDLAEKQYPTEDDELEEKYKYSNLSKKEENDGPYVISTEQFSEENDHYDKLTIYYYEDDDTLTDDNEEIITDIDRTVGDALTRFGEDSDDPEIVYVRNDDMQIDYEVIRLSKSYSETVLGIKADKRGGSR